MASCMSYLHWLVVLTPLTACTSDITAVDVQLAPNVISSIEGKLSVAATVLREREPSPGDEVHLAVDYVDRNGMARSIAAVDGTTDENGVFETTLSGLIWDGTGKVTASIGGTPVEASATFAVLDRTAPAPTIQAPPDNTVSAGNGTVVRVRATDEIGISQVWLEWTGFRGRERQLITSGASDVTVEFEVDPQDNPIGSQIMLYALAEDLSGNQGTATPISVTVGP